MNRGETLNVVIIVAFVCGALLLLSRTRAQRVSPGRFERLSVDSYWNKPTFWDGTSMKGMNADVVAFDTATGQICVTNSEPLLIGEETTLTLGPNGVEPLVDVKTGRPTIRKLPFCDDLARQ
jgi:hypothetical protein